MSIAPDQKNFSALCQQHPGRLIPLYRRFLADSLSPVLAFRRLGLGPYGFLLESVERGERVGRYSFVGADPCLVVRGELLPEPRFSLEHPGTPPGPTAPGNPLEVLERFLRDHVAITPPPEWGLPPFDSGAVGYLGYDIVRLFEPRLYAHPPRRRGIEGVPDLLVAVYRTIVAFDHVKNMVFVIHHADPRQGGVAAAYREAEAAIEKVVERLVRPALEPLTEIRPLPSAPDPQLPSNFQKSGFLAAVARAKEYIAAGDIIQVVLSQRFSRQTSAPPFEVYRTLRAVNPSPYMFYLRCPQVHLVGSSPEIMVQLEERTLTVRPIAGTRRRGATAEEDARLAADLLGDAKERAEHVMLLDLGRNDVGRVSEYNTVKITEQMRVELYSHVMHIVSNVLGRLREGLGPFDVLRSCHPAGTVSGAPKIRAMEIIDELEPDSRGPYAGAVGVLDLRGNLNTAIAIRTFVMKELPSGRYEAHVQAGAGVVADSIPEREYEETRSKALALLRSLDLTEARLGLEAESRQSPVTSSQ